MSKTEKQTSDLPDAHRDEDNADIVKIEVIEDLCVKRQVEAPDDKTNDSIKSGRLEENPGTGLLNVKEEDETDDINSHQTEIHWSLPADKDKAEIVKVEITEELCVRQQLGAPDEETSDSISSGHMDVTPSDSSAVEHGGEAYDQVKTEEDDIPINTATGDVKTEVTLNVEQTHDLYVNRQREAVKQEISDNISTGEFTKSNNPSHCQSADSSFNLLQNQRNLIKNVFYERGKCFSGNSHLIRHQKMNSGKKAFSCSECGKRFTQKANLNNHLKIHTGEKEFSCSECGKCFTVKSNLISHQKIHTGEKAFSCSECGKCFSRKPHLTRHQKIHTGEKGFSCSQCGKCFALKTTLHTHLKIHAGERQYSCSECGKCFTLKSYLISHQKIHTGEKAFSCSDCGKCFTRKPHLVRHQNIHTGEKEFSCSNCGKCFALKTTLNTHLKTHTGEKAFSCSDCGKCFTLKSNLISHQKVHTGEKAFSCSDCGKCFTRKTHLIRHQNIHIGEKAF